MSFDSSHEEKWNVKADSVWQFDLLAAPILSEYRGGSNLNIGRPLLVLKLPSEDMSNRIPQSLWKKIPEHINKAIEKNNGIEEDERIAQLATKTVSLNEIGNEWKLTSHFEITTYVSGCEKGTNQFNLMYQGWLFQEEIADESVSHAWAYPLVGIFDSVGFRKPPDDVQYAGFDTMNWSDQHCHLECNSWHFGSDMAKVVVDDASYNAHYGWVVCADTLKKKLDISLLYIVNDDAKAQKIVSLLQKFDPSQSKSNCFQFVQKFVDLFPDQLNHHKHIELMQTFLFGKAASRSGILNTSLLADPSIASEFDLISVTDSAPAKVNDDHNDCNKANNNNNNNNNNNDDDDEKFVIVEEPTDCQPNPTGQSDEKPPLEQMPSNPSVAVEDEWEVISVQ
ncbi:hypothetical protein RFI_10377 [Reticulomyxa filosa]|uniref:Uncharacterized protein n=1 Tax=Reticulomyxa filosa TaxID=46433 RepID=X6NKB5_RETFI|nr:hypothetical protein RFI_10377 [Reticulomyxa filosa]|eukprot:ETO26760.1 hypothetical protein RFI_10377 [Reticulomyxa filosa]